MTTSTSPGPRTGQRSDRLFTARFIGLAVADLAYFSAAGIAFLALPHFVTGPVGSDAGGAGLAFGAFAITAMVLRPFAGYVTDVVGRRPLLLFGAVVCAGCMVATAHMTTLWQVVAVRLLLGFAEAAFFVASLAMLADLAPPSRMGEALSYNSLGLYLGITIGPILGEVLLRAGGFAAAWYGAAGLASLAAVVVLRLGETRGPMAASDPGIRLAHRPALPAALGFLASTIGMGGFLALAALHARDVGLVPTGLPLVVYGAVVVVCRIAFARVHDRYSPLSVGAASLGTIAAALLVMAIWTEPAGLVVGAAVMGVGVSFSTPAFFAAIFATAAPAQRGAAAGTASVCVDLGLGGGPIIAGLITDASGSAAAFGATAAATAAGSGWTLRLRRWQRSSR